MGKNLIYASGWFPPIEAIMLDVNYLCPYFPASFLRSGEIYNDGTFGRIFGHEGCFRITDRFWNTAYGVDAIFHSTIIKSCILHRHLLYRSRSHRVSHPLVIWLLLPQNSSGDTEPPSYLSGAVYQERLCPIL